MAKKRSFAQRWEEGSGSLKVRSVLAAHASRAYAVQGRSEATSLG